MGRRPHRPSRRGFGPRRGLAPPWTYPAFGPQLRKTLTEDRKEPHPSAGPVGVRSNGRRWKLPAENTSHRHLSAYDQASDVADGYAAVAKLYDGDTSSREAHTAALIAIEGRLNLIAHCLRAIADNSGADPSTVSMLSTEKDNEEVHQQAGLRGD